MAIFLALSSLVVVSLNASKKQFPEFYCFYYGFVQFCLFAMWGIYSFKFVMIKILVSGNVV